MKEESVKKSMGKEKTVADREDPALKGEIVSSIRSRLLALKKSLFIGLSGLKLTTEERGWLAHKDVAGVILFSRNYQDKPQLTALTAEIQEINPELLISVDHEGGRVQRFRDGFTQLPPMRELGRLYDQSREAALSEAYQLGSIMASELIAVGVDFSYAPVCDIDYGVNPAIGDRAFHDDPTVVTELVLAFYRGVRAAGSVGVAKHFPGHGFVNIDTHVAIAQDDRPLTLLEERDLKPFRALIDAGIEALMPAHIIFTALDADNSVISSEKWLRYLREELAFQGAIISDDLDMGGASHLGSVKEKVDRCFSAGIDIVLLCNDFQAIRELLTVD